MPVTASWSPMWCVQSAFCSTDQPIVLNLQSQIYIVWSINVLNTLFFISTILDSISQMLTCLCICLSSDIYCCGLLSTRKSDCTGLPQNMLVCGSTPAQRGQSRVMMKGSMSLISWYNKGHFRFLSNAYSPTKQGKSRSDTPRNKTLKLHLSLWIVDIDGRLFTHVWCNIWNVFWLPFTWRSFRENKIICAVVSGCRLP